MGEWITVTKKSQIVDGKTAVFTVKGKEVVVALVNGELYAFHNECSHMELPLDQGEIEGTEIQCPFHGAKFDLRTGEATHMPAVSPIEIYKVKVDGDDIKIEI